MVVWDQVWFGRAESVVVWWGGAAVGLGDVRG